MSLQSSLSRFCRWLSTAPRSPRRATCRLTLETLEDRLVPTASIDAQGTLQIQATQPTAKFETITLDRDRSGNFTVTEQLWGAPPVSPQTFAPSGPGGTVNSIKIQTRAGAATTVVVERLAVPVPVEIDALGGDWISLSPTHQALASVAAAGFVVNGDGTTTLELHDESSSLNRGYDVKAGEIDVQNGWVRIPIRYNNVSDLEVYTGANLGGLGSNQPQVVNVLATSGTLDVHTHAGGNNITVGSTSSGLNGITAGLSITGQGRGDTLTLQDQAAGVGRTYYMGESFVQWNAIEVNYSGLQGVTLDGANVGSTFYDEFGQVTPLTLVGGSGWNTLEGPIFGATWNITGPNSGTMDNVVQFSNMQNLLGGAGRDTFVLTSTGSLSGTLDGAGGTNTLQYSGWTTPTCVNLVFGTATGVYGGLFSVSNIQNFVGETAIFYPFQLGHPIYRL